MAATGIDRLPEELLLHVLSYLDSLPPSETKQSYEPDLQTTKSHATDLKAASLVSRRWRRIILPTLFTKSQLCLDAKEWPPHWASCTVCTPRALGGLFSGQTDRREDHTCVDRYHEDMFEDAFRPRSPPHTSRKSEAFANGAHDSQSSAFSKWMPIFYHVLRDYLDFIVEHELASSIESIIVLTSQTLLQKLDRFPHRAAPDRDMRYRCAAAFWQHMLSVVDPARIAIIAPPTEMACLTNCAIDTISDWAFSDMHLHMLELRQESRPRHSSRLCDPVEYRKLDYSPLRYPGLARSSLLNLRDWHSIKVNEGSFLKAYGTYEFFEHGPPSLVYSIKDCVSPRPSYGIGLRRISNTPLASLRSFTYTAIFPFAGHLDFRELIPQLEVLDLQLAPGAESSILESKDRIGKADMHHCWSELMSTYRSLAFLLNTFSISASNCPKLKRFVCRDCRIPGLQEELDDIFMPLCLPVWAEYARGEFQRLRLDCNVVGGDSG